MKADDEQKYIEEIVLEERKKKRWKFCGQQPENSLQKWIKLQ